MEEYAAERVVGHAARDLAVPSSDWGSGLEVLLASWEVLVPQYE